MNLENVWRFYLLRYDLKSLKSAWYPSLSVCTWFYDKDNRAYSNSGWLADFGKHFCHPSSPFRHASIRFADFYKHFCFGLHCCLHSGIQAFDSLIFVNIFALVTYVPHERFMSNHNDMSCANSDDWTIKIATYSCDLYWTEYDTFEAWRLAQNNSRVLLSSKRPW